MPKALSCINSFLGCPLKAKSTATIETRGLKWCVMYMCSPCFRYLCQEHNVSACEKVYLIFPSYISLYIDRINCEWLKNTYFFFWCYAELLKEWWYLYCKQSCGEIQKRVATLVHKADNCWELVSQKKGVSGGEGSNWVLNDKMFNVASALLISLNSEHLHIVLAFLGSSFAWSWKSCWLFLMAREKARL